VQIEELVQAIHADRVRITDHADEEARADRLPLDEVLSSIPGGEIIENYPDDKPFPSCLIFGTTFHGDPVHSVWAYNLENRWAVLITVYRPDPQRWENWRTRRPKR
jgi:hypothetical protein